MDRVAGVVVAGGHSVRLGTDKRAARLGGLTLLDRAVALLAAVADDVMVAMADPPAAEPPLRVPAGVRIIPDALPDRGPMAGILAGLRLAPRRRLLVIPVDMPMLTPAFLAFLAGLDPDAAVTLPRRPIGLEPLVAVYHTACLPAMTDRMERGATALHTFITTSGLRVRYVDEPELRAYGDPARLFFNINTPEDLTLAGRLLAAPHPPGGPR